MSNETIHLTDAEWSVMEHLWNHPSQTGREIAEALEQTMGWSRSTTLTLLRRLESKGAVSGDAPGQCKVFHPCILREEVAARETESFLQRVYHGSLSLLVSSMTRKQSLSQKEIDELYAILQNMEVRHDE